MTHNYSPQTHVAVNDDPALDLAHEHHHDHLHHAHLADTPPHDHIADTPPHDHIAYTKGTTPHRPLVPDQSSLHHRHSATTPSEKKAIVDIDAAERASTSPVNSPDGEEERKRGPLARFYARYRIFFHLFLWLFFTGWWIASVVVHRHDKNWLIPFLLYLAISLRLLFFHAPITILTVPLHFVWTNTGVRFAALVPDKLALPLSALLVVAVILIGTFASPVSQDNTLDNRAISLFGLATFIFALWLTSRNRKMINWHAVIVGMLMQYIIALFVLRTTAGYDIFNFISTLARELLGFADQGTIFLTADSVPQLGWFLVTVLPAIVFFVSLVQLLYYANLIQWFVAKFAAFFFWSMRISGAEAVVAAASPFIGQGESAMLIKPFIAHLTQAEIHQVMCSGFATIAGSVLVAYIGLGVNPQALVSSCVMSIPASIAMSKLRYPEEEETLTAGRIVIPDDDEHRAANFLHAFSNGAWLGLKIAGMIMATLLCIIALIALIDGLLTWWGRYINLDGDYDLTLELLLGYICYPIAFLLGVSRHNGDLLKVARLIGIKIVANEFVAYTDLVTDPYYTSLSSRSRLIATYALCGFGNIGSLGNQIGVLAQISPARSGDVSRVAISALVAGVVSTLSSASIAGMVIIDQESYFSGNGTST